MKLLLPVFLVFAACAINLSFQYNCPKDNKLGSKCTCYPSVYYMVCDGLTIDSLKEVPTPTTDVMIKTLIIKNSPELPRIIDHFEGRKLTTENLVVHLDEHNSAPSTNLGSILQFVTKSIEIIGNGDLDFELADLPPKLQSLSIQNVKTLKNLKYLNLLESLTNLELKNVQLAPTINELVLKSTLLKRLVITGNAELSKVVEFAPKECKPDDSEIEIILQNNPKLTDFDLSKLISNKVCKYVIDLSGNALLDKKLLAKLAKASATYPKDKLYLIMQNTSQECYQCVTTFYQERKQFVHSVKCSNTTPPKFLDQLEKADSDKLATCA